MSAGNAAASVVICSYSRVRRDLLLAAAASLRRQTVQPREVVVVVDHNPELLESVTKALPDALVVPNRQARGLSGSRNSGTLACRAEVVAFLDDDAVAAPDWLERLLAGYTKPEVAGVGGRVDGVWEAGRPRWFPPAMTTDRFMIVTSAGHVRSAVHRYAVRPCGFARGF